MLDDVRRGNRLVGSGLQRQDDAVTPGAVLCHEDLRADVGEPVGERVGR